MDCDPQGSSVHGIFQARILEWVAILFSRGSSWPRDWTFTIWASREAQTKGIPSFWSSNHNQNSQYSHVFWRRRKGGWERKLHEQEGRKQEWQNHTTAETREGTEMNEDPKDWERLWCTEDVSCCLSTSAHYCHVVRNPRWLNLLIFFTRSNFSSKILRPWQQINFQTTFESKQATRQPVEISTSGLQSTENFIS